MKKTILSITIIMFIVANVLVSCQNSSKKEEAAKDNVEEARDNLDDAQDELSDVRAAATEEEWKAFKESTNATVVQNEILIAEMKAKIKKTGKSIDEIYAKKIIDLEQRNKDIRLKVETYKNDTNSDWQSFKEEYNRDMNELGTAIKNLTVDNK